MSSRQTAVGVGRFVVVSLVVLTVGAPTAVARSLSFEERVAAQRAIEEVYWRHRIWPDANPTPKPPLSAVLPEEAIRSKVEDYLKMSNVLQTRWHRSVTSRQLQTELDRMSRESRDPATLAELFAALNDDPRLIAETLARPALVQRLARRWYATDEELHAAVEHEARTALSDLSDVAAMRAFGGRYLEQQYASRSETMPGASDRFGNTDAVELDAEQWRTWTSELAHRFGARFEAIPLGRPTELQEDQDWFFVSALLSRSDAEATVATVTWPKRSFDEWWSEHHELLSTEITEAPGPYTMAERAGAPCEDDTWETRYYGPGNRAQHAAVWTGSEMIVWGGYSYVNTGGRYAPATDTWEPTSLGDGVPLGRQYHTGVWTGTEMVVWGGNSGSLSETNTGGRYDPSTDRWTPTSTNGAPSARRYHTAVWTGTEMIVWGGYGDDGYTSTGGRYDPLADTWVATSTAPGTPFPVSYSQSVWTGTEMIVWGGYDGFQYSDKGSRYDPVSDSWVPIAPNAPNTPEPRLNHTVVWTGTELIVWGGGRADGTRFRNGGRYDPASDSWTPTSLDTNTPSARILHTAVWTGTEMIVWGGSTSAGVDTYSGSRYNPLTDQWRDTWAGPNHASARENHTAVWTGTEMIVWGGEGPGRPDLGWRYDPVLNAWQSMAPGSQLPLWRDDHTAIWTGAEMIVWGGIVNSQDDRGGRYYPATDVWLPTGPVEPTKRRDHTAVWTGTEMIIWGGHFYYPHLYLWTGSRYDPTTDTWTPTSTGDNCPSGRQNHVAVWTGTEMIVWGGSTGYPEEYLTTGGHYDPATDTWLPTAEDEYTPSGRAWHTAVWTGTEMIVWGGYSGDSRLDTGSRYDPLIGVWLATSVNENTPAARSSHAALWTGSRMIIWGAAPDNTGSLYDPSTDDWSPISVGLDLPAQRASFSAVWTGDEMIVWGGYVDSEYSNTGSRYRPAIDSWVRMTTTGAPAARTRHTAVWSGERMIVWGGSPSACEVSLYCAATCAALVPAGTPELAAARSDTTVLLNWGPVADAEAYDVVHGSLALLHSSAGDFMASTTGCLENDLESTSTSDDSELSPGQGSWYLVRPFSCAGYGTYDSGMPWQLDSRDAGIDASPVSCP